MAETNQIPENSKDPTQCAAFDKTGCCPKGDHCCKRHHISSLPRCVVFHHLFPVPENFIGCLPQGVMRIGEVERQRLIDAFFLDIYAFLRKFGELEDLVIAANQADHINGNVWAFFAEADVAQMVVTALNEQYYAGRKISCTLASVPRVTTAVCKNFATNDCPKSIECLFVHPLEPTFQLYNECFPRSHKVYAEPFRRKATRSIIDTPNELINGKMKVKPLTDVQIPAGFPGTR